MIYFIIISIVIAVWLIGFFISNDFSVTPAKTDKYKNAMIIFPHPDDEVLTAGGLIGKLKKQNANISLVILTRGEKGTPDASLDKSLINIRAEEARNVSKILGVSKLYQKNFKDGEVAKSKTEVKKYLDGLISDVKPDLVITYDLSGLYGHEDHMVVSEIVTDLVKNKFNNAELWYASLPKRVLAMISLPEYMAKDPEFKKKRTVPSHKVFVGLSGVTAKIKGVYAYKSQFESFRKGLPFNFIPPWFYYSMQTFEYFYKAN